MVILLSLESKSENSKLYIHMVMWIPKLKSRVAVMDFQWFVCLIIQDTTFLVHLCLFASLGDCQRMSECGQLQLEWKTFILKYKNSMYKRTFGAYVYIEYNKIANIQRRTNSTTSIGVENFILKYKNSRYKWTLGAIAIVE